MGINYVLFANQDKCTTLCSIHLSSLFNALHQTEFALAVKVFLDSQNRAAKEYNVTLTGVANSQENVISRLFFINRQGKSWFPLAVYASRQAKDGLTWLF